MAALLVFTGLTPSRSVADEVVGVLELDALSYVSFQEEENLPIPSGATIRFRFGEPTADGRVAFSIQPSDVLIPRISTRRGSLLYSLSKATSGVLTPGPDGASLQFTAQVNVSYSGSEGAGSYRYPVAFTTGSAGATDKAGAVSLSIDGMKLKTAARHVQLVGATSNHGAALTHAGKAVLIVLSGTFDQLPDLP